MKKTAGGITAVLGFCIIGLLCFFSDLHEFNRYSDPEPSVAPSSTPAIMAEGFDESNVVSKLEVRELKGETRYATYAFLAVKNNSEYNLDALNADVTFYDDAGNIIGARQLCETAIESGQEVLLLLMPDEPYAKIEYEFSVLEQNIFECAWSDLTYEVSEAKDKVILSITNNGEVSVDFARADIVFFSDGQVVGYDFDFATDVDNELKPGKTKNIELTCFLESFDSYEVFLSGQY